MTGPFLTLKNISKHYTGVKALDNVDFEIKVGEIHCLVGENGSGKSTLIKVIAGTEQPDPGGSIEIEGQSIYGHQAIDAIQKGIEVIYQDLALFPNLSVAENIALGQVVADRKKVVDWDELHHIARRAMERIAVSLPLDALVEEIPVADQQLVAICRALTRDVKLVIMDEPTASLTQKEVDSLFKVVMDMRAKGIATMFVSHKLNEVLEIAERVTVIRDGKIVGTFEGKAMTDERLIQLMTGKKVEYAPFVPSKNSDNPILEVKHLSSAGYFIDVNFRLYAGEILGITGLLGSGRTELALAIFGINPAETGEIFFEGSLINIKSIQDAIRLGIGYVPEDRLLQGLIMSQSVGKNLIVTTLNSLVNRFRLLDRNKVTQRINQGVNDLSIRVASVDSPVQTLSGGNQQRVVLAKWIATQPKVLILDGPTIGIDVAAKYSIHETIRSLARQGVGIILISDEVSEVFHNCNRLLVMRKGRLVKEFNTSHATLDEIQDYVNMTA